MKIHSRRKPSSWSNQFRAAASAWLGIALSFPAFAHSTEIPATQSQPLTGDNRLFIRVADDIENGRILSATRPGNDDLIFLPLPLDGLPANTDIWINSPEGLNQTRLTFYPTWHGPYLGEIGWMAWLWPFGEDLLPIETRPAGAPLSFPLKASLLQQQTGASPGVYALASQDAFPDPCPGQPRDVNCKESILLDRAITIYFGTWDEVPERRNVLQARKYNVRVVRGPGDPYFFHAAHAYLESHNAMVFVCERMYGFEKVWDVTGEMDRVRDVSRIVVFDGARTELDVLETYYRPGPDGMTLWSIDRVVEAYPDQTVIVNGGYFFTNLNEDYNAPGRGKKAEPHPNQIRGRLIHNGVKSPVSTQRKVDDHNTSKCHLPEYYLAQRDDGTAPFFAEGKVPLDGDNRIIKPGCSLNYAMDEVAGATILPDPDPAMTSPLNEALGGLHQMHGQESASRMRASMVGSATISVDGEALPHTMLFVVSNESGSGLGNENLVAELKQSGAVRADGADNIYQLDTGGSVALAHPDVFGNLQTQFKAGRHLRPDKSNISNYLMFRVSLPETSSN